MEIAIDHFIDTVKIQSEAVEKAFDELQFVCTEQTFSSLHCKWKSSMSKRDQANIHNKQNKLKKATSIEEKSKENLDELVREFFERVEKQKEKKGQRQR